MTAGMITPGTKLHGDGKEQAEHEALTHRRHDAWYRTRNSEKERATTAVVKSVGSHYLVPWSLVVRLGFLFCKPTH